MIKDRLSLSFLLSNISFSFFRKIQTCDLFGNDSVVLGKLIYTLGVVIQASDGLQVRVK